VSGGHESSAWGLLMWAVSELREGTAACFTCSFHPPENTPESKEIKFSGPETLEHPCRPILKISIPRR
jgi:hypothetical protein